jgi:hypothetical protein
MVVNAALFEMHWPELLVLVTLAVVIAMIGLLWRAAFRWLIRGGRGQR